MAYLRKSPKSPFYIACFRDLNGKQFNRSTKQTDKESALKVATSLENEIRGGSPTLVAMARIGWEIREKRRPKAGDYPNGSINFTTP
jgi:hypothetical protein